MQREHYIGVMSGTSLDGVDVVLCDLSDDQCRLLHAMTFPFPNGLREDILELIAQGGSLKAVGTIDHRLGHLFADAVNALIHQNAIDSRQVRAIGLHGQTLWHEPSGDAPFSMQLGDANIVAQKTGVSVVADFRRRDMALGGQGAPFAPAFHEFLFKRSDRLTAVVNIGGMANITLLGEKLLGYDTGPGNVLMDLWYMHHHQQGFDASGSWARSGKADEAWLQSMLEDDYFHRPAPKSTGREYFNEAWMQRSAPMLSLMEPEDVQATLTELTAVSIADEVKQHGCQEVLLCGGGAKNSYLVERIKAHLPEVDVDLTDSFGVDGDYLEAMAFAWLACKRVKQERVNLCSVTGASENTIAGCIYA